jgi:tetratricopeptide (TPR) repeat protein
VTNAFSIARRRAHVRVGRILALALLGAGAAGQGATAAEIPDALPSEAERMVTQACVHPRDDGSRIALLIGNTDYVEKPLVPPPRGVHHLAETLRCAGFAVEVAENLTKAAMAEALEAFYARTGKGATVLFFFSGYGLQSARRAYLLPVNANIWTEADVAREGVPLAAILAALDARGAGAKVALVDAAREGPFEARFRADPVGLAVTISPRSLVVYSASPAAVIPEGIDGLFVSNLIESLQRADLTFEQAANRTRIAVSRASRGQQVPWIYLSLEQELYVRQPDAVTIAYRRCWRERTKACWQQLIAEHPVEPLADNARRFLAEAEADDAENCGIRPQYRHEPQPIRPDGSDDSVIAACTRVIERHIPLREFAVADALRRRAGAYHHKREYDRALADYDRLIGLVRTDAAAYAERGNVLYMMGAFERAESDFTAALDLRPSAADLNDRCWTRATLDRLDEALADCEAALRLRPNFAEGLDSRGFVLLRRGELDRAIADFDAALRIESRRATTLWGRGKAKHARGDAESGDRDLAAAAAIDSNVGGDLERWGFGRAP